MFRHKDVSSQTGGSLYKDGPDLRPPRPRGLLCAFMPMGPPSRVGRRNRYSPRQDRHRLSQRVSSPAPAMALDGTLPLLPCANPGDVPGSCRKNGKSYRLLNYPKLPKNIDNNSEVCYNTPVTPKNSSLSPRSTAVSVIALHSSVSEKGAGARSLSAWVAVGGQANSAVGWLCRQPSPPPIPTAPHRPRGRHKPLPLLLPSSAENVTVS